MKLSTPALKIVSVVSLALLFFASGSITYLILSISSIFVKPEVEPQTNDHSFVTQGEFTPPKTDSVLSVLMLGYGGAGHDGGTLSDVLMLARIDYEKKIVTLISIPRDLWVELPIRSDKNEYFKINMAHAIGLDDTRYGLKEPLFRGETGGGEMAKFAVSMVTGIPVDYFVSIDFEGFKTAIDIIGEIDVDVPATFEDNFYPVKGLENETCGFTSAEIDLFHRMYTGFELEKQFTCRYEQLHFIEGIARMDGETALKFVRSRHSDTSGGDFARSQRQQAVLDALKNSILTRDTLSDPRELKNLVDTMSTIVRTDAPLDTADKFLDLIGSPSEYTVNSINLSTDNVLTNATSDGGAYILVPRDGSSNWENTKAFISSNLK